MTHEIREIMNEEKEKNLLRTKRPFPNSPWYCAPYIIPCYS